MKPESGTARRHPKPSWIRVPIMTGEKAASLRKLKTDKQLHTVCESALCPNIGICWGDGQATFMIMGPGCTRDCRFCAVNGMVRPVDPDEPERVAGAVKAMGLKHAVVTSVTRDDLPDGGAYVFAALIAALRRKSPETSVEILIPDFQASRSALEQVVRAAPDILGHNVETVPRLYSAVRPQADFRMSVNVLETAKSIQPLIITKSGLMVGLGETHAEVLEVFRCLRKADVDILTIGQYLQPGKKQLPVVRYYHPDEFAALKAEALDMGFGWVESGPLVRSSYQAEKQAEYFKTRKIKDGNADRHIQKPV